MRKPNIIHLISLASIALWGGCSEDDLTGRSPELAVVAYPANDVYNTVTTGDDPVLTIDLGNVAVYATRVATFELQNPSTQNLTITSIEYASTNTGSTWLAPLLLKEEIDEPQGVPAASTRRLEIGYSPTTVGAASADILIYSNARGTSPKVIRVTATGVFEGAPEIEIVYNDISDENSPTGPAAINCETELTDGLDNQSDGVIDGCRMGSTLDIGKVGLGKQSSARFYIRNAATCAPFPSAPPCGSCVLVLDKDSARQNIGVGFKAGSNDAGHFSFQGSTATPATVPQLDETCTTTNIVPLVVLFNAPTTPTSWSTVVVIESNDPDEPLIEIPITAEAVNAPVAIAALREPDPNSLTAPYTDANDIAPLDRVYMDGRAKGNIGSSHDPNDPTNTALITDYSWEIIEYPPDANPGDFDAQDDGQGLFSILVSTAGFYVAQLTVTNSFGQASLDTAASKVEFSAIPQDGLHLQLTWDHPSNDLDLHLSHTVQDDRVCNEPYDVFYSNKRPIWNSNYAEAEEGNPVLDRDDTNGIGPENINIDAPDPGVYRVYVHYFGNWGAAGQSLTENVLKIYINGVQGAQYKRSLDDTGAVWAVADITWLPDGTASIAPYPSDAAGETGAIEYMQNCSPPTGWTFP
jgi:hypothetical protein